MRLYTIPYAGGFSFTYLKWKKYLHPSISLYATELPGRGAKVNEPLCESIIEMGTYLLPQIDTRDEDYVLFGHSMGAFVLIEIYRKLKEKRQKLPKKVIISGMKPPHLYVRKNYHHLDEEGFKEKLFELGGIPKELTADEVFTHHLFYLLRNDFRAVETYPFTKKYSIFECPVILFNSEADITCETMMEWASYTRNSCDYYRFEGTHFFINEDPRSVVQTINKLLCVEAWI